MKLLIPDDHQGYFRPYSPEKGIFYACISYIVRFSLIPDAGSPEPLIHLNDLMDEGLPKPRGEFLLSGSAYSPSGPVDSLLVMAGVGDVKKELAVFGDRKFLGEERISAAEPFVVMPLSHKASKPSASLDVQSSSNEQSDSIALPNIESPHSLIASTHDRFSPEGFGPLSIDSPERTPFLGTFDDQWFENRWPHLPLDGRPDYFQMARHTQQNASHWVGHEPIVLKNLHPDHPVLESRLPGLKGRIFGLRSLDQGERFEEIQTQLDTVWLFPESLMGALVFRGVTRIKDSRGSDLPVVLGMVESLFEPATSLMDCYKSNESRIRAALLSETLAQDPKAEEDAKIFEQLLSGELTPQKMAALVRDRRTFFEQLVNEGGLSEEALMECLRASPHTEPLADMLQAEGSIKGFLDSIERDLPVAETETPSPPETPPVSAVSRLPDPPPAVPVQPPSEAQVAWLHRTTVLKLKESGTDCAYMDLAGANLSGLDLSGMNFSRALLSGARFAGAKLKGCRFDEAFLNGANFQYASLEQANFSHASLGDADFTGSNLKSAVFDSADCSQADFRDSLMESVSCSGTLFSGANLSGLNLTHFHAARAQFINADLSTSTFKDGDLGQADFSRARLMKSKFSNCRLTKADFSFANAASAAFSACDLSDASGCKGSDFSDVHFLKSTLDRSGWVGVNFNRAQIIQSSALETDLSDADLREVRISGTVARQLNAVRSTLTGAQIENADMMEAMFSEADFDSVRFRGVNLYGATFMDVNREQATFDDCNLNSTVLSQ